MGQNTVSTASRGVSEQGTVAIGPGQNAMAMPEERRHEKTYS